MSANLYPTFNNPLIDRNPPTTMFDNYFDQLITNLRNDSGLKNIYGGYTHIDKPITSAFEKIGSCIPLGINVEEINELISNGNQPYLFFIAIPIDDSDALIEKPSLWDCDFEEKYLSPYIKPETVCQGKIMINDDAVKLRTIRFVMYL